MRIRLPDTHYDNIGQKLSATKVNQLIRATQLIDGWSFRRSNTFDSSGGDHANPYYLGGGGYHTNPGFRLWKGGALYKTGATTLTINGEATPAGAEVLSIYVNGVLEDTIGPVIPSTWTSTIALSGYTEGDPIWVEIRVDGSAAIVTRQARYYVYEAYIDPITAPSPAWVAPTAFTTTLPAAKIEAVKAAIRWLHARMNTIPQVPRLALLYQPGPYRDPAIKPEMEHWPLYYGSILRGFASSEVYRTVVQWTNYTSVAECWKLYIDGALVYTSPVQGPGTWLDTITIPIAHTVGTRKEIWIHGECITPGVDSPPDNPIKYSRYHILVSRTEPDGAGYPYWSAPAEWAYGTKTFANVIAALNAVAAQLNIVKARIDAAPHLWGRWYLQRKFYADTDEPNNGKGNKRSMPQLLRMGERLVAQGKGVSIGWANFIPPTDTAKLIEEFAFGRTESLIGTETIDRTGIYLDNYPDLFLGTLYYGSSNDDMLLEEYLY